MDQQPDTAAGGVGAEAPSPFSKINPRLQLAWDATSLYALMWCQRYYKLTILDGWRPTSVDFVFGLLYHGAQERGDRVWASGGTVEEAQLAAFEWALEHSGRYVKDFEDCDDVRSWEPWGGRYEQMWRCTHAPGPGRKKCEYAKAHCWFPEPAPSVCCATIPFDTRSPKKLDEICGSPTETKWLWIAEDSGKNRETLIRAVVWYWEEIAEAVARGDEVVRPFVFPDGTQAIEMSFRLPLGVKAETGENYILCGHMDGLVAFGDEVFVRERKSTKSALSKHYFTGFSPNVQVDVYDLAGKLLYPQLDIKGVMVEAAQTLVSGARYGRQMVYRTDPVREEFLQELLHYWLPLAEKAARTGVYPMNKAVCRMCKMREICKLNPDQRETFLEANFEKDPWNPLEVR